jgi:hypothetical protein
MTRRKKKPQNLADEKLKARKRARKAETVGRKPVQRKPAGLSRTTDADSIKDLQQTVGNRVVARLVAQGAGTPAVQRDVFPASEETELAGGATTKGTMPGAGAPIPGAAPPAPMPYPGTSPATQPPGGSSKVEIGSKTAAVKSSKMGSSKGDEPGTMAGMTNMNTVSNNPGASNVVFKPSPGIVPIQSPGTEEGTQQPPAPTPQPEEQEAS